MTTEAKYGGSVVLRSASPVVTRGSDGPVRAVRDAIRAGIGDVLPEVPEKADGFTPHVSVAYSAADGPAAPVAAALSSLDVPSAGARISSAELIVLHRDNLMYEWETYTQVPLG